MNNIIHGLPNYGNTCFVNTIVQCLKNNPLVDWKICNGNLAKLMLTTDTDHVSFLRACRSEFKSQMRMSIQNDIQEFFLLLIDKMIEQEGKLVQKKLDKAVKAIHAVNAVKVQHKNITVDKIKQFKCSLEVEWWRENYKLYSPIVSCFRGQLVSQMKCSFCKHITHNTECFYNIDLDMNMNMNCLKIDDMMHNFFKDELITEWKCDKCKKNGGGHRTIKITRLPKTLVLTLKRFGSDAKQYVDITRQLTLTSDVHIFNEPVNYNLYAVGCHTGSRDNGHYYAMLLSLPSYANEINISKQGFLINDDHVTELKIELEDLSGTDPYMLFFVNANV